MKSAKKEGKWSSQGKALRVKRAQGPSEDWRVRAEQRWDTFGDVRQACDVYLRKTNRGYERMRDFAFGKMGFRSSNA
jgi:hypothetical protein